MQEKGTAPRRPRGRPQARPDDETLRVIADAARGEFMTRSFSDVSMASVAQRAGVSTKTMYRLVPTKADLFRNIVLDRMGKFVDALDVGSLDALAPIEALTRLLTISAGLILSPDGTTMYRLAVTERDRFPDLAAFFFENAIGPAGRILEDWLRRQRDLGVIEIDDPAATSGMLRGMIAMDPQRAVLLGQRSLPDAAEVTARARTCAELFLNGCLVGARAGGR
ncbi:MAG TPA: TetR/AcrR family transcriptional regulator [Alphaproteobacteria bacterium]|jgi:AcrR family transcriptional regulator|nr:TetR/AcrR family transcriptional regulator [Alphaproteobacteria bacterium]